MTRDRLNPLDLVPSDELAGQALELLRAGDVQGEFPELAHHLSCRIGELQAITEGTLLMAAADLITIRDSEDIDEVSSAYRRVGPYIEFARARIRSRELRPIGRAILEHSVLVAPTQELRDMLADLSEPTE